MSVIFCNMFIQKHLVLVTMYNTRKWIIFEYFIQLIFYWRSLLFPWKPYFLQYQLSLALLYLWQILVLIPTISIVPCFFCFFFFCLFNFLRYFLLNFLILLRLPWKIKQNKIKLYNPYVFKYMAYNFDELMGTDLFTKITKRTL